MPVLEEVWRNISSESVLTLMCINALIALSLYVPFAAGQFSAGVAGFMAVGAYVASVASVRLGWGLPAAFGVGTLAAGLLGLVVGVPALRVSGLYLGVATIGVGEIVRVFFQNFAYTGGLGGMQGMMGTTIELSLAILLGTIALLACIANSRLGLVLEAIKEDEMAAAAMGVNTTIYKLLVVSLGAAISGLAGALYAHYAFVINPDTFGISRALVGFVIVVFGGLDSIVGVVLGAVGLTAVSQGAYALREWQLVVYGGVLMLTMLVRAQGLVSRRTERKLRGLARRRVFRPPGWRKPVGAQGN